ncbi:oligosaccharide flippase family protein [Photobacterium sp. Alg240-V54]|uniref:oligosaccharide flippase family protein n=1 Tax=Photobacterium sp. Alg240-V54 TaxID=2305995 RepID=UPI0013D4D7C5|nr:oligosaccharide flippase family protein [Photobacterium sp. Alg240-V54]
MNIIFSYLIQISIILTPILSLPILSRVLDTDEFNLYLLLQSLCVWISYVIDYGFIITATKLIKENKKSVSNIIYSKLLLSLLSLIIYVILSFIINVDSILIFLSSIYMVLMGMNFYWYFIAVEKLKNKSIIEFISSSFFILILLFFLNYSTIDINELFCLLIVSRAINIFASIYCIYKDGCNFEFNLLVVIDTLRYSFDAFILKSGATLYTVANGYIISLVLGVNSSALYLQSERIIKSAFSSLVPPLTNAIYPKVIRGDVKVRIIEFFVLFLSLLLSIFLYIFRDYILSFFYHSYSYDLLLAYEIFIFIIPIISMTNVMMFTRVYKYDLEKKVSKIILIAGLINIIVLPVMTYSFNEVGAIISCIFIEFVILISIYVITKNKVESDR